MKQRLRELDFLRGLAIILVLSGHFGPNKWLKTMGWIGVDLFFVLSGFFISQLLFKEYDKYGNIDFPRFLIRRGFKIYPIYYLTYSLYFILLIDLDRFAFVPFLGDMFFLQNYISAWGWAYGASWSLAVEEHFYFGIAFVFWKGISTGFLKQLIEKKQDRYLKRVLAFSFLLMLFFIMLRVASNLLYPEQWARNTTMTHLRIDSLLTGVLVSYLYYFKKEPFRAFIKKHKYLLIILAVSGFSWTGFINRDYSFFVKTVGFSLLYISFSIVLSFFLLTPNINSYLDKFLSRKLVDAVSKVGLFSYSIYIIHSLVNICVSDIQVKYDLYYNDYLYFVLTSSISISLGMFMTYKIEGYFLGIRDRIYPRR
ncbi:acyltransferase [Flammeovirgaceae bacterium SG7u.111]|nr:acyltransferase [Flammeovirgaceae bacterium SG7u.132]WPO36974.1 acyltransferase [Flammeovirgaceae bacterium SG7u.111]